MTITEAERLAPHSIEAEEALLGACLIEPDMFSMVKDTIKDEDFFMLKHRMIWGAMVALADEHQDIDDLIMIEKLRAMGTLEEIGGPVTLTRLMNIVPEPRYAPTYAYIIRQGATRRRLLDAASRIAQIAQDESAPISGSVDHILRVVNEAAGSAVPNTSKTMSESLHKLVATLEDRFANPKQTVGLATGYRDLDRVTGGLRNGALTIVAARPGMGKTSLVLNIAANVARAKQGVLVFSLEMTVDQLVTRMLSGVTGINSARLDSGRLNDSDWKAVTEAQGEMDGWRIRWHDRKPLFLHDLESAARQMCATESISLIVLDYIGLLDVAGFKPDNTVGRVSEISRRLTILAGELGIPILAAAQLNRNVENRQDKHPQLSDLRDSGGLEQDAWAILFPYRDAYYDDGIVDGSAEIEIAKNRSGPTETIRMRFDKHTTTFHSVDMVGHVNVERGEITYSGSPQRETNWRQDD